MCSVEKGRLIHEPISLACEARSPKRITQGTISWVHPLHRAVLHPQALIATRVCWPATGGDEADAALVPDRDAQFSRRSLTTG